MEAQVVQGISPQNSQLKGRSPSKSRSSIPRKLSFDYNEEYYDNSYREPSYDRRASSVRDMSIETMNFAFRDMTMSPPRGVMSAVKSM